MRKAGKYQETEKTDSILTPVSGSVSTAHKFLPEQGATTPQNDPSQGKIHTPLTRTHQQALSGHLNYF